MDVFWVEEKQIIAQMKALLSLYKVSHVKIGLIKNTRVLTKIVRELYAYNPNIRIIWDPILSASAGKTFHDNINPNELHEVCKTIYLATPNLEEMKVLFPKWRNDNSPLDIVIPCAVLVKGGHGFTSLAKDVLYWNNTITNFEEEWIQNDKHGTGCVLSSSITACLAGGMDLKEACLNGKKYISEFIKSSPTRLGNHDYNGIKAYC